MIKDEATFLTALRTAKLDMLEAIRWSAVEELKKNAPGLQWTKWLNIGGTFLAMRVDTKPFDDIRVRRALNMAVNKQEIVKAYYSGNAELFAYPMHPTTSATSSRWTRCRVGAGAVRLQPGEGQGAARRSRLPEGLQLQGAGVLVLARPHGPAAAGRRIPREGRREDGNPADGVRRVPVGDDDQDQRARLLHAQRPHQPDHVAPQELRHQADLEPVAVLRPGVSTRDEAGLPRADEGKRQLLIKR